MSALGTGPLPLVGRADELATMRAALDSVAHGEGMTWLVAGDGGVGKTRFARATADEAERRGWHTVAGRAFAVESGVPYALFADALLPVVRRLDEDSLTVLTRGVDELTYLFPWLARDTRPRAEPDMVDFRSRLHWHFTQFLRGLVGSQPLLVVLEDLQWADTSSLELLHFVARQVTDAPLFLFCTCNPQAGAQNPALRSLQQSLVSSGAQQLRLEPLDEPAVGELLHRAFGSDPTLTREFTAMLYRWTRGNPFFVEETLKALIASGDLRVEDQRWVGWQVDALQLPASVRDAVLMRLEVLSAAAREAADTAAVLGARFLFDTLAAAVQQPQDMLLAAVDELRRARVLEEIPIDDDDVVYDFVHPLIRETLYGDIGRVRVRLLHARVADALEQRYGDAAPDHAGELAYHFARAHASHANEKAARYLDRAGRQALVKHANREASDYLSAALERLRSAGAEPAAVIDTTEALARAQQRLGEYDTAEQLWIAVQQWAVAQGDPARAAAVARRMGLACYWRGRLNEALAHFDDGLSHAAQAHATPLRVRLHTARAACLQELARADEALDAAREAMRVARSMRVRDNGADPDLLIRVHRAFLQLHLWKGDADLAREHGNAALALVGESADRTLGFMVHWAMGVLEAFSGNAGALRMHLDETERLAEAVRSPVLRAWSAELALEYASARGDWQAGLTLGEDAIRLARALHQWTLLPRLLVWTGLIHLGRSDIERGAPYVEEAWELSGAGRPGRRGVNVHAIMPAYIGRAGVCLARGDYRNAVRLGEEALAIADSAGYALWGVHRVMPIIAESYLWMRDLEGAKRIGARLRRDAERLGNPLGVAWATACDALVVWLGGDSERGAVMLREAAEALEAVPLMADATRLRRQLAGRLAEIGDRDGAVQELRIVHERLRSLGADAELRKARLQFKELGTRPPPLGGARSDGVLTRRETAIAERIAARRSSKAIARDLKISVRTVDAHLANIYRKLSINSRAELADLVRSGAIYGDGAGE